MHIWQNLNVECWQPKVISSAYEYIHKWFKQKTNAKAVLSDRFKVNKEQTRRMFSDLVKRHEKQPIWNWETALNIVIFTPTGWTGWRSSWWKHTWRPTPKIIKKLPSKGLNKGQPILDEADKWDSNWGNLYRKQTPSQKIWNQHWSQSETNFWRFSILSPSANTMYRKHWKQKQIMIQIQPLCLKLRKAINLKSHVNNVSAISIL